MKKLDDKIYYAVQTIWNYHLMHENLVKSDAIMVLGTHDIGLAEYGSKLYNEGFAPLLIFTGGVEHPPETFKTRNPITEAEAFAEIAIKEGVPRENILIENKATNTGENFSCTKELLAKKNLSLNNFILVQKPYMERRTYATAKVQWPDKNLIVTSPKISLDEYLQSDISTNRFINTMVGDLQRIKEYPKLGFQIEQHIPNEVWDSFEFLVENGYNLRLLK